MKKFSGSMGQRGKPINSRARRKRRLSVCLALLFILSFVRPVKAAEENLRISGDIQRIVDRGELVVAVPSQDLPVFFEEDEAGQLSGVDVDLARGIANSLGVELRYDRSSQTYDDMTEKLLKKEVDLIIATYSMTSERAKYVTFSEPYLVINMGLMMNKQMMVRNDIESSPLPYLKKHKSKLAAVKGTSHVQILKNIFPKAEVAEADNYEEAYRMVQTGEADGFFCGELEFLSAYINTPSLRIYTSVFTFKDINDQFAIGVSEDTPKLLSYINTYIQTAKMETKQQVEERYVKAGKNNGKN